MAKRRALARSFSRFSARASQAARRALGFRVSLSPGSTASTVVPVSLASVELTPVALEPEPQDRFDGTPVMFPKSAAWKISYANADLAGETVELTVTCLDEPDKKGGPDSLSATYQVELNKKGKGSLKARLPEGWRLVRLDGPTAKPLFAVRL